MDSVQWTVFSVNRRSVWTSIPVHFFRQTAQTRDAVPLMTNQTRHSNCIIQWILYSGYSALPSLKSSLFLRNLDSISKIESNRILVERKEEKKKCDRPQISQTDYRVEAPRFFSWGVAGFMHPKQILIE